MKTTLLLAIWWVLSGVTPAVTPSPGIFSQNPEIRQVVRFLSSESVQDILTGLDRAQNLPWTELRSYVVPLTTHKNQKVSARAVQVMVHHKDPDASSMIRQTIAHSIQAKERVAAINLLGALENPADHAFFLRLLRIENQDTRVAVISWIAKLKIPNAVMPLIQLLEDSRDVVRAEAVRALAAVAQKQALLSIISRLSDSSQIVRQAAIAVLKPEDLPLARHALMRLLQSGSRTERIEIIKLMPFGPDIKPHYLDLVRTSRNEEMPAVIQLFSGTMDLEMLKEFVNLASTGIYNQQLQEVAPKITVTSVDPLYTWILSPQSNFNIRNFCALLLMNTPDPRTPEIMRRAWRLGYFSGAHITTLYRNQKEPLPVQFLFELFSDGTPADKTAVVETFIHRKDDRLAPLFLAALRGTPELGMLLLGYAEATGSRLLIQPLLEILKTPQIKISRRDVLMALKDIATVEDMPAIVATGPDLARDELVLWSEILWPRFSAPMFASMDRLPLTTPELEKELSFFQLLASTRRMTGLSRFRKFRLPANPQLHHLWMHFAMHGSSVVPQKLTPSLQAAWMDLLPAGAPPAEFARTLPTEPRLLMALARFNWPRDRLAGWFAKGGVCVRINVSHAWMRHQPRNDARVWTWIEKETHPLVLLNLLLGVDYDPRAVDVLKKVCRAQPEACRNHLPVLTAGWPKAALATLGELPIALGDTPKTGTPSHMMRFHFPSVPSNLSCLAVGNPGQGFRALSILPESDLAVLHLTGETVTLHPQYR
ncbi:HEAT repeat domain-containing protein [Myxococcota bacterium]|nr:HEAT repeat domain-containing protein [Myxococcota bacterium]